MSKGRSFGFSRLLIVVGDIGSILIVFLTIAATLDTTRQYIPYTTRDEKYDPRLATLHSVDAITAEVRRLAPSGDPQIQAKVVEDFLRYRFYHGYSRYDFSENWILWIAARTVNPDLDAKVAAEDILEHPWAACSQQGIVAQAVLNRLGIQTATVEWPHHFTAAAFIKGQWHVVDPWGPMERDRSKLWTYADWVDNKSRARILGPNSENFNRDVSFEPPRLTKVNQFPAPTMAVLHPLTKLLSNWLWVLALTWLFSRLLRSPPVYKKRRSKYDTHLDHHSHTQSQT